MSFRFKRHESVRDGFHRIVSTELDAVKALLQPTSAAHSAKAVHDARKRLKMLRSLLRLFRNPLGKNLCRDQVHALGQVADGLAPARDARVRLAALDAIAQDADTACAPIIAKLRRACETQLQRAERRSLDHQSLAELQDLLTATHAALVAAPLDQDDWELLAHGVQRTHRRVRKAQASANKHGGTTAFHDWRKRTKDMQYQMRLFHGVCPKEMKRLDRRLDRLNEVLGDDHDLALLEAWLHDKARQSVQPEAGRHLLKIIAKRRHKLQRRALHLGDKWLSGTPRHFTSQLARQWRDWRD